MTKHKKQVKCIRDGVTGECYDIVDAEARKRLDELEASSGTGTALEEIRQDISELDTNFDEIRQDISDFDDRLFDVEEALENLPEGTGGSDKHYYWIEQWDNTAIAVRIHTGEYGTFTFLIDNKSNGYIENKQVNILSKKGLIDRYIIWSAPTIGGGCYYYCRNEYWTEYVDEVTGVVSRHSYNSVDVEIQGVEFLVYGTGE